MSIEKQKTIDGTKWTVIVFSLSTVLAFLTNLFIARISPEAVGYFTLIAIFINTISTFVFLGGGLVFPVLLPKIKSKIKRASFINSYFMLIFSLMILSICIFAFFPTLFEIFLKEKISNRMFYLLLSLIPFILMVQFSQSLLNGLFEIKLSSIIERLRTIVLFIFLLLIYLINKDFFIKYFVEIIIVLTMISSIFGFRLSFHKMFDSVSFKKIKLFYLPKGFWSFLFTAQMMSLLSYSFNNFDKIIVAQHLGIKELGIYSVIILIWSMTRLIPQLVAKTQIPLMSKYVKEDNREGLQKIFQLLNRYIALFSILLGFFILIFSKEILMIFGSKYVNYSDYLNVLILTSSFLTLSYSVTPLLVSFEYNRIRLVNSIAQITIQVLIIIIFLKDFGIWAVVAGIAISIVIAQIYPCYKIFRLKKYIFNFPKDFIMGVLLTSFVFVIMMILNQQNIFYKFMIFLSFSLIYMYYIKFNNQDIIKIKNLIGRKNV